MNLIEPYCYMQRRMNTLQDAETRRPISAGEISGPLLAVIVGELFILVTWVS